MSFLSRLWSPSKGVDESAEDSQVHREAVFQNTDITEDTEEDTYQLIRTVVEQCLSFMGYSGFYIDCVCHARKRKDGCIVELKIRNHSDKVIQEIKNIEFHLADVISSQFPKVRFRLVWSFGNS